MNSQKEQILSLLNDYSWHCTSEMYALYIADPRTRLCEIKKLGYILESRKCQQHSYHKSGSKEWSLVGFLEKPKDLIELKSEPKVMQLSLNGN